MLRQVDVLAEGKTPNVKKRRDAGVQMNAMLASFDAPACAALLDAKSLRSRAGLKRISEALIEEA